MASDAHEQQADAVADAVVRGEDAAPLLGARGATRVAEPAVQLKTHEGPWPHEIVADGASRDGEKTSAKRERDYKRAGAFQIGEHRYRLWGFEVGLATPRGEFAQILGAIANKLVANPESRVRLVGHTSASGGDGENFGLSVERAATILQQLAARGVQVDRVISLAQGEKAPIADEKSGPSAMAKNRRVEVEILPAPKPADSAAAAADTAQSGSADAIDTEPYSLSCAHADFWARMTNAEVVAWTMVASGSRNPVTHQPRVSWETFMQPSMLEWEAACRSEGISKKWCEYRYPTLTLPINANLHRKIEDLKSEREMYRSKSRGVKGCGSGEPEIPRDWVPPDAPKEDGYLRPEEYRSRVKDRDDLDRMPGDVDPKGRHY